ncbi:helix-turn-helix domain-containing protein [Paracholeplasma manati]|uniref:helix-turn-helix domain-containing protein n=1 Tax=Paracholeplasma manati TaxID=591373 RepID=UPI00358F9B97
MKATGKNIESLRKQKNLSVKEIQEVFGFESPQAIYKWQWGDSLPSIDNLVVLATVFEVSIVNILVID